MITIQQLKELDKKGNDAREEGKNTLRDQAKNKNIESKIVFPRSHLKEEYKQLRLGLPWIFNGFIIYLPGIVMVVDPGVDFTYRMGISDIKIGEVNTIFISHEHLDHVASANTLSDYLIRAGQNTEIIAPLQVLEGKSITPYHAGFAAHYTGFKAGHFATPINDETGITLVHGGYSFKPIELFHGPQCFGFTIEYSGKKLSYISDTGYAKKFKTTHEIVENGRDDYEGEFESITEKYDSIKEAVKDSDTLIINVENLGYEKKSKSHLTIFDVVDIVKDSQLKSVVIAHANPMGELLYEQWAKKLAEFVEQETGIQTVAPSAEGLVFEL